MSDAIEEARRVLHEARIVEAKAERLLEIVHVAARLGVSRQFARRLCQSRQLPAIRLGRRWRVRPSDLERFIEANRAA